MNEPCYRPSPIGLFWTPKPGGFHATGNCERAECHRKATEHVSLWDDNHPTYLCPVHYAWAWERGDVFVCYGQVATPDPEVKAEADALTLAIWAKRQHDANQARLRKGWVPT